MYLLYCDKRGECKDGWHVSNNKFTFLVVAHDATNNSSASFPHRLVNVESTVMMAKHHLEVKCRHH